MKNSIIFAKILPIILFHLSFMISAQEVIYEYTNNTNSEVEAKIQYNADNYTNFYENAVSKIHIPTTIPQEMGEDDINDVTITVNFIYDPSQFILPAVLIVMDQNGHFHFQYPEGNGTINMSLPNGEYDIYADFRKISSGVNYIVVKELQNFQSNTSIDIDISEATNHVTIETLDQNGQSLDPGIPNNGINSQIFFDRRVIFNVANSVVTTAAYNWNASFGGNENIWNFYINDVSERYSFLNNFIGSFFEDGTYVTKHETITGISESLALEVQADDWTQHTERIQPSNLGDGDAFYAISTHCLYNDFGLGGWTINHIGIPVTADEAFVGYINNTENDDPNTLLIYPAIMDHLGTLNPYMGEEKFFLRGNMIFSTEEGNVEYGNGDLTVSYYFVGNDYFKISNINTLQIFPFHPKFSFTSAITQSPLMGDNVPLFVSATIVDPNAYNYAKFQYKGRFGENREADFFNVQVEVKHNGTNVFTGSFLDYVFYIPPTNGDFEIKLTNTNMTIDGMTGTNSAILTYNADDEFGAPPTVQFLQFRNGNDEITHIFDSTEGATLRLAAGDFVSQGNYYTYHEGNTVEVSYSLYNENNWLDLELTEYPEYFQMPAFADYYEASLSQIDGEGEHWYDLKIICTDADGNKQEQVLSPAFKIDHQLVNTQDLTASNLIVYPNPFTQQINVQIPDSISGDYTFKITDLNGKLIHTKTQNAKSVIWNSSSLPKGVYILSIENNGKLISKKIIKK